MKDLQVLYEDNHILVCVKPQNVPSQADSSKDKDMLTIVKEYIKKKYGKPGEVYCGLVHRLDRPTGGVMVFARTSKAAKRLSEAIRNREVQKTYLAVTAGALKNPSGNMVHYLKKNTVTNTVYTASCGTNGAKKAELEYETLANIGNYNLLKIRLLTGRGHQIRVQMATSGTPICGDHRYGNGEGKKLSLWATVLRFEHPVKKQMMTFVAYPPEEEIPWKSFDVENLMKKSFGFML